MIFDEKKGRELAEAAARALGFPLERSRPLSLQLSVVDIYALIDPRDGRVRYVGKANQMRPRLLAHLLHHKRKCGPWIRELAKLGTIPGIAILERCERAMWRSRERYYIETMRRHGFDLFNAIGGGGGHD